MGSRFGAMLGLTLAPDGEPVFQNKSQVAHCPALPAPRALRSAGPGHPATAAKDVTKISFPHKIVKRKAKL